MPNWSQQPPADLKTESMPLMRTPPKGKLKGLITSDKLIGCPVHWWRGRSMPCDGERCPACEKHTPWRWKGYICLWTPNTTLHFILELPAAATDPLGDYLAQYETLRGAKFTTCRIPEKPTGKVHSEIARIDISQYKLPQAPNILNHLSKIWDLPAVNGTFVPERNGAERINILKTS